MSGQQVEPARRVQYGPEVASQYDSLIGAALPVESTVALLRPVVTGKDVLEIGVGTGRVAAPVAPLTRSFTGIDNSPDMLAVLGEKGITGDHVSFLQCDFRSPFATDRTFDTAYSTLGSLACVDSRDELLASLRNVADRLRKGGSLWMEYYARDVYARLAEVGTVTGVDPQGRAVAYVVELDDASNVLTMQTRLTVETGQTVQFAESVLLLEREAIEESLAEAGFATARFLSGEGMPYDLYIAEMGNEQ